MRRSRPLDDDELIAEKRIPHRRALAFRRANEVRCLWRFSMQRDIWNYESTNGLYMRARVSRFSDLDILAILHLHQFLRG
jgi:hypothetical protein